MGRMFLKQLQYYLIKKGWLKNIIFLFAPIGFEYVRERVLKRSMTEGMKSSISDVLERMQEYIHTPTPKRSR